MGLRQVSRGDPTAPGGGNALPPGGAGGAAAGGAGTAVPRSQAKPADLIYDQILAQIEPASAVRMARPELAARVEQLVAEIANQRRLLLNQQEQQTLAAAMVDDMIGLGPLEPLLRDDTISDILVNSPRQTYVERRGKLVLTNLQFRNNRHVLHVAQRIASAVGRRAGRPDMIASVAAVLLLAGGALILAAALGAVARQRAVARRVDLITGAPVRAVAPVALPSWRGRGLDGLRSLFTFRMRRSWGVSASPVYLLVAGLGAAVAVGVFGLTVVRLPGYAAAIGAAGGFFALPRFVLFRQQRRADRQFAELLPDAIDMVVRVVRAGLPVGVAMRTVGQETEPPLNAVFVKIADQTDIGLPLGQALATTSETIGNPDFRFFAVAVALQQATGGNLTVTLETLSQIIRKRRAVRLKAGAATAEVRMSGIVLGAIPFVVTGLLLTVAPAYLTPLFADPRGNIILGLALLGLLLAGLTMRAMIRNSLTV